MIPLCTWGTLLLLTFWWILTSPSLFTKMWFLCYGKGLGLNLLIMRDFPSYVDDACPLVVTWLQIALSWHKVIATWWKNANEDHLTIHSHPTLPLASYQHYIPYVVEGHLSPHYFIALSSHIDGLSIGEPPPLALTSPLENLEENISWIVVRKKKGLPKSLPPNSCLWVGWEANLYKA